MLMLSFNGLFHYSVRLVQSRLFKLCVPFHFAHYVIFYSNIMPDILKNHVEKFEVVEYFHIVNSRWMLILLNSTRSIMLHCFSWL